MAISMIKLSRVPNKGGIIPLCLVSWNIDSGGSGDSVIGIIPMMQIPMKIDEYSK